MRSKMLNKCYTNMQIVEIQILLQKETKFGKDLRRYKMSLIWWRIVNLNTPIVYTTI